MEGGKEGGGRKEERREVRRDRSERKQHGTAENEREETE